ncbi:hypothetical protein CBER1_00954 [Cercospora berteroae]|uniref:Uncharacterized protein n=1 Tax=Cercospora berteroae TaxID=357750 RepID=A0A2S6C0W9_9PEZI|nr:hypothetical protein CBER1_00954 [Cercospora berteroae]
MAAAEYFQPGGRPSYLQPGPPNQNNASMPQNPPYPLSNAPPPYSAFADARPHSQPPPQQRPPNPADDIYRPAPPPANAYPPEKSSRPPHQINDYYHYQQQQQQQQSGYTPQQRYQQQQGYFPAASGSGAQQQIYRDDRKPSTTPGYKPSHSPYRESECDRSRSRSRSRSRDRHRKHHDRPQPTKKKSSGVNTFLGAGGGALIGDAIFPGLGTLGGALLGGLGGHEYGKKRASSNPNQRRHRSYSNDFDYGHYNSREDDYNRRGRKY